MRRLNDDSTSDDIIKRGLTGFLGAWLLVHEKADDVIREAIEKSRGKPNAERDLTDRLVIRVFEEKESLKKKLEDGLNRSPAAEEDDIKRLEKMISGLAERIEKLEEKAE